MTTTPQPPLAPINDPDDTRESVTEAVPDDTGSDSEANDLPGVDRDDADSPADTRGSGDAARQGADDATSDDYLDTDDLGGRGAVDDGAGPADGDSAAR